MTINGAFSQLGTFIGKVWPFMGAIALILGAQVVWPRERQDRLEAQQIKAHLRIDSVGFRIDSLKLQAASEALITARVNEEINRRLMTLSILACSNFKTGQGTSSLAFRLAGCPAYLAP